MTPEQVEKVDAANDATVRAYHACFNGVVGQLVLTDLVTFCRGAETTFVRGDPAMSALLEGRREVLLRIQRFARLDIEEILRLRLGRINPKIGEAE